MNSLIENYYPFFKLYQDLRDQMMALLHDEDLAFTPGGQNPTLGALCREIGQVERSYIDSFNSSRHDFSYEPVDPSLESDVSGLTAWFAELDKELKTSIDALPEASIKPNSIDRGGGFVVSPQLQLEIYKEALLIFYGKVSVYLKLMGVELTHQWQLWIA